MVFAVPADHSVKFKGNEKKDKYLDFVREIKKLWNMKVTVIPIVIGALGTWTGGHGNKGTRGDHPDYSIFEIGTNIEKSPRDLRTLVVTQTPVEDHPLMLV